MSAASGLRIWALAAVLAATTACGGAKPAPTPKEFQFGTHRVEVMVPNGWEAVDLGKQKRFRKGEFEIILEKLGSPTTPPRTLDELVDWGLAGVGHNQRREEKSRRTVMLGGREAVDIETWN